MSAAWTRAPPPPREKPMTAALPGTACGEAAPVLLAREDVLAVEQHRVIAELGDGPGDRLVVARARMAGEEHDDRALAGRRRIGGLRGPVGATGGRRGARAAGDREQEERRGKQPAQPHGE